MLKYAHFQSISGQLTTCSEIIIIQQNLTLTHILISLYAPSSVISQFVFNIDTYTWKIWIYLLSCRNALSLSISCRSSSDASTPPRAYRSVSSSCLASLKLAQMLRKRTGLWFCSTLDSRESSYQVHQNPQWIPLWVSLSMSSHLPSATEWSSPLGHQSQRASACSAGRKR